MPKLANILSEKIWKYHNTLEKKVKKQSVTLGPCPIRHLSDKYISDWWSRTFAPHLSAKYISEWRARAHAPYLSGNDIPDVYP
jgi:hypothetical protein